MMHHSFPHTGRADLVIGYATCLQCTYRTSHSVPSPVAGVECGSAGVRSARGVEGAMEAVATPLNGRRAQAAENDGRILDAARAVFVADPGAPIAAVAARAG